MAAIPTPNTASTEFVQTETTRVGLRRAIAAARAQDKRIGLVPTMGYLHEGHLALVDHAKKSSDFIVMTIFVNPLQFGPKEDLATYPRDLARDSAMADERGVDLLFAPPDGEMYPGGPPAVTVVAKQLADKLCGRFRPGHFEGVLTVVAKLFDLVQPDVAVFGQKDFQQAVLIKRMGADLDFPIDIQVAPTVREADGLAMSSRNTYLDAAEHESGLRISRALFAAHVKYLAGERAPNALVQSALEVLRADARIQVQYVELVDPRTLDAPEQANDDSVMAIAVFVGKTRLIDNAKLGE